MSLLKITYIIVGTLSLILGIIGIVVPGLPTTPFLLLTAGLYMRSSNKLYNWLLNNKYLGRYIRNYRKNKGLTLKNKMYAIILQWVMISISVIWGIDKTWVIFTVIIAGLAGTLTILLAIPTIKIIRYNENDTISRELPDNKEILSRKHSA